MTTKATKKEIQPGKIGSIIRFTLNIIRSNPDLLLEENYELLKAHLRRNIPELSNREVCPNCDASMIGYTFVFDAYNAYLLMKMAEVVQSRLDAGLTFTEANKVHVPTLKTSHAIKCRTTQASKLGLIVQDRKESGHRIGGTWIITRRGWKALRGENVPKQVSVWRGKIEERCSDVTTIREALTHHRRRARRDESAIIGALEEYDPSRYVDMFTHDGRLL